MLLSLMIEIAKVIKRLNILHQIRTAALAGPAMGISATLFSSRHVLQ